MRKLIVALTSAVVVSGAVAVPVLAVPAAVPTDPASVDTAQLARDALTEINRLRADPATLAANLIEMRRTAKVANTGRSGDLKVTLPDGSTSVEVASYLDSAIADAQALTPRGPLTWADGLAKTTEKYANSGAIGHRANNTTLAGRTAEFGLAGGPAGPGEGMTYGGTTGMNHVYALFIDSGTTNLGHRHALIDPTWTRVGIGCHYPNPAYHDISCVVDYAQTWTEKNDLVKLQVGKQYALRDPIAHTFRYVTYDGPGRDGVSPRVAICPALTGLLNLPDIGDLTTVEEAGVEALAATNAPCGTDKAPHGILANGTSLPGSPTPVVTTPSSTAAPSTDATRTAAPTSTDQPVRTGDTTTPPVRTGTDTSTGQPIRTGTATSTGLPIRTGTATSSTPLPFRTAPTTAPLPFRTAVTTPGLPFRTAAPTTPLPVRTALPGANVQQGKEYAVQISGTNQFQYARARVFRANGAWVMEPCPDYQNSGYFQVYPYQVLTVATAVGAGLSAINQPCAVETGN